MTFQGSPKNVYFFPETFNSPVTSELIERIGNPEFLYFGKSFNQPLDDLPENIVSICLVESIDFDHPLDNLPQKLNYLNIGGYYFNRPIDFLPPDLKDLYLPENFNQPLNNLPRSLEYLNCGVFFNQPLNNLPEGLKKLRLCGLRYKYDLLNLPDSLEKLEIYGGRRFLGKIKEGIIPIL